MSEGKKNDMPTLQPQGTDDRETLELDMPEMQKVLGEANLIERLLNYKKALDLALYYVEGDATYDGVNRKVDEILNDEPTWTNPLVPKKKGEISPRAGKNELTDAEGKAELEAENVNVCKKSRKVSQFTNDHIAELEAQLEDYVGQRRDFLKLDQERVHVIDSLQTQNRLLETQIGQLTQKDTQEYPQTSTTVTAPDSIEYYSDRIRELETELSNADYERNKAVTELEELEKTNNELRAHLVHRHYLGKTYDVNAASINRLIGELEETKEQLQWSLKNEQQYKDAFEQASTERNQLKEDLKILTDAVFEWASRPTRDGAKELRNIASNIGEME
jgi:hypothetical protein